jgi:hypothetical protein
MRWHNVEQKAQPQGDSVGDSDDPLENDTPLEEDFKKKISEKYGSKAYESAYQTYQNAKKFGRGGKTKFEDFNV